MLKRKGLLQCGVLSAVIGRICGPVSLELTPLFQWVMFLTLPLMIVLAESTVWQVLPAFVWGVLTTTIVLKESNDGDGI